MFMYICFPFVARQLPVENDTFEAVGSWCCMAGTVTAILRLDRKGYVLKEAIPVWAEIKNLSARRIAHTMVSLVQGRSLTPLSVCLSVSPLLSICLPICLSAPCVPLCVRLSGRDWTGCLLKDMKALS